MLLVLGLIFKGRIRTFSSFSLVFFIASHWCENSPRIYPIYQEIWGWYYRLHVILALQATNIYKPGRVHELKYDHTKIFFFFFFLWLIFRCSIYKNLFVQLFIYFVVDFYLWKFFANWLSKSLMFWDGKFCQKNRSSWVLYAYWWIISLYSPENEN